MLKKITATAFVLCIALNGIFAQDSSKGALKISGSVDMYYRTNFADVIDYESGDVHYLSNNTTSFTNSQNAFQMGMASLKAEYTQSKVGVVADLGFGPRAEEFSYADKNTLLAVKQAYLFYAPSDKVKITVGKWATHIGYELVDAYLNKNYSMSYMFSYGPFSHTGIKADFTLGKGFGLMVGIANPTDVTAPLNAPTKTLLGQVSYVGSKVSAYLNYQGYFGAKLSMPYASAMNQIGLTATGTVTDKFSVGLDGTIQSFKNEVAEKTQSWYGVALYFNYACCKDFGLTLRGEYFGDQKYGLKTGSYAYYPTSEFEGDALGANIFEVTLSGQYKVGNFTFIPELRLDNSSQKTFAKMTNGEPEATKSSATAILAAIYNF